MLTHPSLDQMAALGLNAMATAQAAHLPNSTRARPCTAMSGSA